MWNTVNRMIRQQRSHIKHHPTDLNDHFATLASRLTNKTNTANISDSFFDELKKCSNTDAFGIQHMTFSEVKKTLLNLKNDCSSGFDGIPVRYIKPLADYIASPLVHIINNSIDRGTFPNARKVARVCPIPNVDHPTNIIDYRPISVLPFFSKVYECVILNQLCIFIDSESVYSATQSGFHKRHSTATVIETA